MSAALSPPPALRPASPQTGASELETAAGADAAGGWLPGTRPERALLRYARRPREYAPGHRISGLLSGARWLACVTRAVECSRRFVHIEIYRFASDAAGARLGEALARAAERGVVVRLVYDVVGTATLRTGVLDAIERRGVRVRAYRAGRALGPWARTRNRRRYPWSPIWNRRNHRKFVVVDGRVAYIGGVNVVEVHERSARRQGGRGWRDYGVRVQGPAVAVLDRLFAHTWRKRYREGEPDTRHLKRALERRRLRARLVAPRKPRLGGTWAAVVATGDGLRRDAIVRAYAHAIEVARETVCIWNPYFLPGGALRRALLRAAQRGVEVSVIVPLVGDVRLVQWAMSRTYGRWLREGVKLLAWRGPMMHAKVAVVDERWITVGSANLDPRSRHHNAEANLMWVDRRQGAMVAKRFRADARRCERIELERWRRRPWWLRALELFATLFRPWL